VFHIYTGKPSKVLFALTKLLMTDEVTRFDGGFLDFYFGFSFRKGTGRAAALCATSGGIRSRRNV
jgi:hypothetical protein